MRLAPGGPAPLYSRIYRDLKRRIESGALAPGTLLPSQRALSREFDVTLMTLRQAIGLLKQEGLVVTRQGAGTRVAPRRFAYSVGPLRSLAQEMAQQGLRMTTRVVRAPAEPASPVVAAELELQEGAAVLRLERLRSVEGEVVVYQHSYLPAWIGRAVLERDLASRSLYDVLTDDLGFSVDRASERIQPILLGRREARLLQTRPRTPAVLSTRLTYTTSARPILYDRAYLPGDRLVIAADRRRDDLALRYELRVPGHSQPATRPADQRTTARRPS